PSQRDADREALSKLLVPQIPADLQSAAMTALARIPDALVAKTLTAGWKGYTPALKAQALDLLLSRDAWQAQLLEAMAAKHIPRAHLDAKRRQRLLEHKDAAIRIQAAKLFDAVSTPDRQKVLRDFQDVLSLTGDKPRGKAVFAKTCANC